MPSFTVRQDRIAGTTETWKAWYEAHEVEEWVQSVVGVLDQGWNDQSVQSCISVINFAQISIAV